MPMNANDLRDEIKLLLEAKGFDVDNEHSRALDMLDAMANGIVNHLITNMEISGIETNVAGGTLKSGIASAVPVALDGGLALKGFLVTATASTYAAGTQNNDGTGHVT